MAIKRLYSPLCCFVVLFVLSQAGCSSKQDEFAALPNDGAGAAGQGDPNAVMDEPPMEDAPEDDGSSGEAEGSESDVAEASDEGTADEAAMASDEGDGEPAMAEDDAAMADEVASGRAAARVKPKNLREQADQAFGDGLEIAAYRLLEAHILASSSDATELLAQYRWSPARRQPQLGVRIAVAVDLTAASEMKDYKPIGSLKGFINAGKASTRNRLPATIVADSDDGLSTVFAAPNNKERIIQKYAGLMGDVLVDHVKTEHVDGKWSPVFQSLGGVVNAAAEFAGNDGSEGDEGAGMAIQSKGSKVKLATKIGAAEAKYISVGPVLTYIGNGKPADLIEQAKEGEFDALVVFDVEVTVSLKLRLIHNQCRARLVNVADGKSLAASKLLKNTEAQKEIDKQGIAFVETAMQPLLAKLDETVALKEIPSLLTPEIIKSKRLETLLSDTTRSKLETLAEIRLWREKSLLTDEDLSAAFETLLGPTDGKALASGTDEERLTIVKKLLAGS